MIQYFEWKILTQMVDHPSLPINIPKGRRKNTAMRGMPATTVNHKGNATMVSDLPTVHDQRLPPPPPQHVLKRPALHEAESSPGMGLA